MLCKGRSTQCHEVLKNFFDSSRKYILMAIALYIVIVGIDAVGEIVKRNKLMSYIEQIEHSLNADISREHTKSGEDRSEHLENKLELYKVIDRQKNKTLHADV